MHDRPSAPLTVTELTLSIKSKLERSFPELSVQGEISNFKPNSSGHLYFDLKDAQAKIPAVFFRTRSGSLARMPKEGDQVTVRGSLSVYAPHGRYQLIVTDLQFMGIGELLIKLEQLKERLKAKGFFEKARKRALPKFPERIGVVTSPTGAVIRDIIQILTRRAKGFHLILNPVRVQGAGAAEEIAEAIKIFNKHKLADVLIVGRGGGSLEDLWPFNEEVVQQAIFESAIPIISAVGHETDFTLADFVADMRAPTPSAAAEIVLKEHREHLSLLSKSSLNLSRTLSQLIAKEHSRLERFAKQPVLTRPDRLLLPFFQRLHELERECNRAILHRIEQAKNLLSVRARAVEMVRPMRTLKEARLRLVEFEKKLESAFANLYNQKQMRLKKIEALTEALNPKGVLKRGYSILFEQKGGSAIVSADRLEVGKSLFALLADGEADLVVSRVEK